MTQGAKSIECLNGLRDFFQVGQVVVNRRHDNHKENLYRYVVRKRKDLSDVIIPFFKKHKLQTSKKNDFEKFVNCVELMNANHHLTQTGLSDLAEIAGTMNRQKPRKINQYPQRLNAEPF